MLSIKCFVHETIGCKEHHSIGGRTITCFLYFLARQNTFFCFSLVLIFVFSRCNVDNFFQNQFVLYAWCVYVLTGVHS